MELCSTAGLDSSAKSIRSKVHDTVGRSFELYNIAAAFRPHKFSNEGTKGILYTGMPDAHVAQGPPPIAKGQRQLEWKLAGLLSTSSPVPTCRKLHARYPLFQIKYVVDVDAVCLQWTQKHFGEQGRVFPDCS